MNLIIPVAGEGIRLRPHTHTIPKSLLYVAGKPILGHILDSFKGLKISKVIIVHGEKGEAIVKFCGNYPYNFQFVHQEKRLGLGHAIFVGAKGLKGSALVVLGDTIIDCDFRRFVKARTNVLAVKEVNDPKRFGIVQVRNKNVVDLVEKPQKPRSNLAIVGLYYFLNIKKVYEAIDYVVRNNIRTRGEYQLTDALKHLLQQGEKFKVTKIENWYDCGTASALIATNRHLLMKSPHPVKRRNAIIVPPVYIADSAKIVNSIIGPYVSIGENATIAHAVIKDSIINRGATIENSLLTESIIGENAIVKGGFRKLNVSDSSVLEIP